MHKTRLSTLRAALSLLASLSFLVSLSITSPVGAQTAKRHALLEEGTGTWCGYCPFGAYTIDSMERIMGDNLVVISWHGQTGEEMYLPAGDTLLSYAKSTGFPYAVMGRSVLSVGAPPSFPNSWYTTCTTQARTAPLVDFRIVNAVYNPSNKSVDFDLDITPFDLSKMPKEDTTSYVTLGVLTEDGPVFAQHRYAYGGLPAATIDDFHHYNVARKVAGKVLGDPFTLGTKTAVTYPVRKHYHMTTSSAWVTDSLRIRVIVATKSKGVGGESYLDASQTGYITALPSSAANAVWTVLPRKGDKISSDSASLAIVWSKAGAAGASVKMSYSIDNGTTWTSISDAVNTTTYRWTLPAEVYGKSVLLRVTDGTDGSLVDTAGPFDVATRAQASLSVLSPATNDTLVAGSTTTIKFQAVGGVAESRSIFYSTNGGNDWLAVATLTGASSYSWTVPNTPSNSAMIQVKDANNVVGTSGTFVIMAPGNVSEVTVAGAPNVTAKSQTTINWVASGYLGGAVNIDVSFDNKATWTTIVHGYAFGEKSSYDWSVPDMSVTGAVVRLTFAGGATAMSAPFNIQAASVALDAEGHGVWVSPNPVSSLSTMRYTLSSAASVSVTVFDLLGREVMRADRGTEGAGEHEIVLDLSKLAPGSYGYLLHVGTQDLSGKLSVVR